MVIAIDARYGDKAHIALQQELRVVAQNVLRAVRPTESKSRDDKEDVYAKVAVLAGKAEILSLSTYEVAPSHGQRGKGAERIDERCVAWGRVSALYSHVKWGLHPSSITCHRGL